MLFGGLRIRGPVMASQMEQTLRTVTLTVGAFLLTVLVVAGGTVLYQNRNASIDLSPRSFLSDEEVEILSDRKGAQSKTFDQLGGKTWNGADTDYVKQSREAWERAQQQQQMQNGRTRSWKK